MNKLAFVVTTPPNLNLTTTAIKLVSKALENGYEVVAVFFYKSGVLNAANNVLIPNDEFQICQQWSALASRYQVPLQVCSTAADKHGLSEELPSGSNVSKGFELSGLGSLVELTTKADRVIQL